MTREEAISKIRNNCESILGVLMVDRTIAENVINEIYDDFENKVCKNCEHQTKLICKKLQNLFGENFGCNRFEREKNERD